MSRRRVTVYYYVLPPGHPAKGRRCFQARTAAVSLKHFGPNVTPCGLGRSRAAAIKELRREAKTFLGLVVGDVLRLVDCDARNETMQ